MQIRKLIVYSYDGRQREVDFELGQVNVITGASKTGKTQIAEIVRFCLGKKKFEVAVGIIRQKVKWFGMLVQFADSQAFIARPNPGPGKKSTNEAYLEVGREVTVPFGEALEPNTTTDGLTRYLSEKLGIADNLFIPDEGHTRDPLEASAKHAFIYNFQGQDEIASRKFLFHRQGEQFMPQAIKDTLPYFLGAVANDRLAKQQELRNQRTAFRRLTQRIEEADSLRNEGLSKGRALLTEAAELGLAPSLGGKSDMEQVIAQLTVVRGWAPGLAPHVSDDALTLRLEQERSALNREFQRLASELRAAKTLAFEQDEFSDEANEQRARLRSLHVFGDSDHRETCPLCHGHVGERVATVEDLRTSLSKLEGQLAGTVRERQQLNRFITDLEAKMDGLKRQISEKRRAVVALAAKEQEQQQGVELDFQRAVVKGKVLQYLEHVNLTNEVEVLQSQLEVLQARIKELEQELDNENVRQTVTSILNILGRQITDWARHLQLEHSHFPLRVDPVLLTIVADTDEGPVPMWEMGSGENWVGYHLVAHLALHHWFIQRSRPVPRFLFLDQPTQVYYPPEKDREGSLEVLVDEDREAVKRMLQLLFDATEEQDGALQVILTDHVDIREPWFQDRIIERWRGGTKLVPVEWPDGP